MSVKLVFIVISNLKSSLIGPKLLDLHDLPSSKTSSCIALNVHYETGRCQYQLQERYTPGMRRLHLDQDISSVSWLPVFIGLYLQPPTLFSHHTSSKYLLSNYRPITTLPRVSKYRISFLNSCLLRQSHLYKYIWHAYLYKWSLVAGCNTVL